MPQHVVCRSWLNRIVEGDARFGLSPLGLSAVVRITTNPRAFRSNIPACLGVLCAAASAGTLDPDSHGIGSNGSLPAGSCMSTAVSIAAVPA